MFANKHRFKRSGDAENYIRSQITIQSRNEILLLGSATRTSAPEIPGQRTSQSAILLLLVFPRRILRAGLSSSRQSGRQFRLPAARGLDGCSETVARRPHCANVLPLRLFGLFYQLLFEFAE